MKRSLIQFAKAALICSTSATLFIAARAQSPSPAAPSPEPAGELVAYASMGSGVARSIGIGELGWSDAQLEAFVAGLRAAHAKRPYPIDAAASRLLADSQRQAAEVRARENSVEPADVVEFLRSARRDGSMQQSPSGLLYRIMRSGSGPRPRPQDTVVLNLQAKMADGSTELPQLSGQGFRVKLAELPPGLVEGVQMMALGSHAALVLRPGLSFGNGPWPQGIERGTVILLRVELVEIIPEIPAP